MPAASPLPPPLLSAETPDRKKKCVREQQSPSLAERVKEIAGKLKEKISPKKMEAEEPPPSPGPQSQRAARRKGIDLEVERERRRQQANALAA